MELNTLELMNKHIFHFEVWVIFFFPFSIVWLNQISLLVFPSLSLFFFFLNPFYPPSPPFQLIFLKISRKTEFQKCHELNLARCMHNEHVHKIPCLKSRSILHEMSAWARFLSGTDRAKPVEDTIRSVLIDGVAYATRRRISLGSRDICFSTFNYFIT
jgi:hypothetical protein